MSDEYDIVNEQNINFVTDRLRDQTLMEAQAWHGWSGRWLGSGWMMLVAGPTRHAAQPELQGLPHRWSWPYEPSHEEQERRLGEESVVPADDPRDEDDHHPDPEGDTEGQTEHEPRHGHHCP